MYCQKPASPIKPLQLACIAILSLGFLASAARRADAEPPSELSALRVLLPESGFIECALWNPDDGAYEAYGYDLGTGAWYERRFGVTRARLSDGTMYWPEGEQGAKFLGRPDRSLFLERRVMPFIWLREITKHPEAVHSVTAASDGTREIVFEAPNGDPALVGARDLPDAEVVAEHEAGVPVDGVAGVDGERAPVAGGPGAVLDRLAAVEDERGPGLPDRQRPKPLVVGAVGGHQGTAGK